MSEAAQVASDEEPPSSWWIATKYGGLLATGTGLWLYLISKELDGVYLDEEFHVRQALVYFDNRFTVWDPKITTPPGLYVVAYPWLHLLRILRIPGSPETHLRSLNAVGMLLLWFVAWSLCEVIHAERQPKLKTGDLQDSSNASKLGTSAEHTLAKKRQITAHVALNIVLFPVLFFFGGLFYTDILSALFVLLAHLAFRKGSVTGVLAAGAVSLFFRQTNIFWTAIYLAGLEVRRQLRRLDVSRHGRRKADHPLTWNDVVKLSWTQGALYDPDAPGASVEDYAKCALSMGLAALANLQHLIVPLAPYLILLGAFSAFVVVNGGVVLGDKSNHMVSFHVPQLLYIWPCFAFFSFPVMLTNVMLVAAVVLRRFYPSIIGRGEWHMPDAARLPSLWILAGSAILALIAIHFNTIVHPFILADNRHYTFYVFRLLLRHPLIKYLVAPVYICCGWLCINAGVTGSDARRKSSALNLTTLEMIVWLIATVASLATAPLVEPRYFILPWMIWRLIIPIPPAEDVSNWDENEKGIANVDRQMLDLETNWLFMVNVIVAYIFLTWHFEWPQQPGQIMRFMW